MVPRVGERRLSLNNALLVITTMWLEKPWLEETEKALLSEEEKAGSRDPTISPVPRQ